MSRSREFDDELLRATALGFFWSAGYEKTSVAEISAATKIGNGSIYSAYGSKLGLFMSVFEPYCASRVEVVRDAMAISGSSGEAVRHFFDVIIDDCANQPGRRGCLMLNSIVEFGDSDPAIHDVINRTNREMTRVIAGRLGVGTDDDVLASHVLLMSQALIGSSRLGTSTEELRRVAEAYCDSISA